MSTRFGLSIRAADPGEAASLADLLAEAGLRATPAEIADRIGLIGRLHGTILLAHEWGPPSGVVVLSVAPSLAAPRPVGRISFLLVGPDARRRGIGRLLVKAAAQAARSAGCGELLADGAPHVDDALVDDALVDGARIDGGAMHHAGDCALAAFWQANGFSETGTGWNRPLRKKAG